LRSLRPRVKTVYISGFPDEDLREQKLLDPGVPFVHKPFSVATLVNAVRDVLGSK